MTAALPATHRAKAATLAQERDGLRQQVELEHTGTAEAQKEVGVWVVSVCVCVGGGRLHALSASCRLHGNAHRLRLVAA